MSKYNEFDPWEHYEDEGGVVKIRAPKIKKIKKEHEYVPKKKKRR